MNRRTIHAILHSMKRTILFFLAGLIVSSAWAVEIQEQELEKTAGEVVEFFNYEGPHDKIETDAQIRSIGEGLSGAITNGTEGSKVRRASYFDKYRIVHIIAPLDQQGLNADVFIILEQAQVDHIDNIRRILAGYVRDAYGISWERADALAVFITYYNAVYRGDSEYIQSTYNEYVYRELDPEKIGIARRYDEWPGKTQILIPLTELEGAAVPAAETLGGDEQVVEELRKQEDRGIEERKEVVEMREEQLEEDQQMLEEEKEELREKEEELEEIKERPETTPAQIEQKEREIGEQQEEIAEKEEALEERKEKIAAERERVSEDQQEIIAREEAAREAVEEREAEQEAPAAAAEPVSRLTNFILIEERQNSPYGTLVLVDGEGDIRRRSRLNTIRNRDIIFQQDRLFTVAGEDNPPRAVRLVALDAESLEIVSESDADVFSGTVLRLIDGELFCVVREGSEYHLGRFNTDLQLEQRSEIEVARFTALSPSGSSIVVQRSDGQIVFLDRQSLEE